MPTGCECHNTTPTNITVLTAGQRWSMSLSYSNHFQLSRKQLCFWNWAGEIDWSSYATDRKQSELNDSSSLTLETMMQHQRAAPSVKQYISAHGTLRLVETKLQVEDTWYFSWGILKQCRNPMQQTSSTYTAVAQITLLLYYNCWLLFLSLLNIIQ